jgi:diguanylate cyclase (GGDEF)-like protein/PAS domain S-box-containing protein
MPTRAIATSLVAQFASFLEAVPDASILLSSSGTIMSINSLAVALFGYDREALLGQGVDLLLPAAARAAHVQHRAAYASNPRTRIMGAGMELAGCRADGSEFAAEVSLATFDLDGEPVVFAAIRDLTERKRVEAKVSRLEDEVLREEGKVSRLEDEVVREEGLRKGEQKRADWAEKEAVLDDLTGLGNRRSWKVSLDQEEARCVRYGRTASVLFIDLDDLKQINDAHGHPAGDALLRRAAEVISAVAREGDFIARIGGDEFTILAINAADSEAMSLSDRLHNSLREAGIEASSGYAVRSLEEGLRGAWRIADQRMYAMKAAKKVAQEESGDRRGAPLPVGTPTP